MSLLYSATYARISNCESLTKVQHVLYVCFRRIERLDISPGQTSIFLMRRTKLTNKNILRQCLISGLVRRLTQSGRRETRSGAEKRCFLSHFFTRGKHVRCVRDVLDGSVTNLRTRVKKGNRKLIRKQESHVTQCCWHKQDRNKHGVVFIFLLISFSSFFLRI